MRLCPTCCDPVNDDDVICFGCLSACPQDPADKILATHAGGTVEPEDGNGMSLPAPVTDQDLYEALLEEQQRTKYSLTHEEIFPGLPSRHNEKDQS